MKRKFAILLVLAMAVTLVLGACAEKHQLGEWIDEFPATCEIAGVKGHYHCSHCNKNFNADKVEVANTDLVIPAKGHTEVVDAGTPATCEGEGITAGKHCSVCGKVTVKQETIPAKGHDYGEWITAVPSTVTEPGVKGHYHCKDCGKDFDEEKNELTSLTIPPEGHEYGEWIPEKSATCKTEGTKGHYTCSCCGKFFNEAFEEIDEADLVLPVIEHSLEWIDATEPTCGQDGTVGHYKCTVCGGYFDAEKNALETIVSEPATGAHNYGEWIPEISATQTEDGVKGHYHCDGCGKNFDEEHNELDSLYIPSEQNAGWSIIV